MAEHDRIEPGPIERRRIEQLRFRLTGRWSRAVVAERLARAELFVMPMRRRRGWDWGE